MQLIDYVLLVLIPVLVVGIGIWKSRTVHTSEDFIVGSRNLGFLLIVGSMVMSEFSFGHLIVWVDYAYDAGVYASIFFIGLLFAPGTFSLLFAKRWRRLA